MRLSIILAIMLAMTFVMGGCAYVDVRTPYDTDLDKTELGSKKGTADAYSVLWLFAWGDASYAAAAQNGNIRVLKHADQEMYQLLFGAYTRWRVIVYGD